MKKEAKNYYEILDISLNANPENIRTAYIRAKNAFNRDSLASYSLFDREESREILNEIEEAFGVLSDSEKRRRYDEAHGIVTSESIYDSYHRGNHAVAAFSRDNLKQADDDRFTLEDDPFRKAKLEAALASVESNSSHNVSSISPKSTPAISVSLSASNPKPLDPALEEKFTKFENVNGAFLKEAREYRGYSQDEIMNILKISRNYINALENDDFSKLPATVFVRGFVIQYAKALKLDAEKLIVPYMAHLKTKRP